MPSSLPANMSEIAETVRKINPKSILDVGAGFGEYLDILQQRYDRKDWVAKIDALEVWEKYITPVHKYVYNKIIVADVTEDFSVTDGYELLFLGDVLEHFSREQGLVLLESFKGKWIVINTPGPKWKDYHLSAYLENKYEAHEYIWEDDDFKEFKNWQVVTNKIVGSLRFVLLKRKGN